MNQHSECQTQGKNDPDRKITHGARPRKNWGVYDSTRQNYVQKSWRPYEPWFARYTEKFRVIGAERSELEDFFAVDGATLDAWARDHPEFAAALNTQPSALAVTSEDLGIYNWLKDYRRDWYGT